MKVAAISYRVPSLRMTNDDMIAMVDRLNPKVSSLRKVPYFRAVEKLYSRLGAKSRYLRDIEAGEKASDLILSAMDDRTFSRWDGARRSRLADLLWSSAEASLSRQTLFLCPCARNENHQLFRRCRCVHELGACPADLPTSAT